MHLNLHHLHLFYHTVREHGVSAAARQMKLQQPAITIQLRALEELTGTLIDRESFEPTEKGQYLYDYVADFFAELEAVSERLVHDRHRQFVFAASEFVLRQHVPDVVALFKQYVPKGRIKLRHGSQAELTDWVRAKKADLAVTELNHKIGPGLSALPVLTLKPVLLVHRSLQAVPMRALQAALAGNTSITQILAAALMQGQASYPLVESADYFLKQKKPVHELICPCDTECVAQIFNKEMEKRGIEWPVMLEASTTASVTEYVARNLGVGVSLDIPALVSHPEVRMLELPGFPGITYGVVWRSTKGEKQSEAALTAVLAMAKRLWPEKHKNTQHPFATNGRNGKLAKPK